MTRRALIVAVAVVTSLAVVALAIFAILAYTRISDFVQEESVQRVHTIGERCETTHHELEVLQAALPASSRQVRWFAQSYARCLKSLAKVEARAGVHYTP